VSLLKWILYTCAHVDAGLRAARVVTERKSSLRGREISERMVRRREGEWGLRKWGRNEGERLESEREVDEEKRARGSGVRGKGRAGLKG
jgi:hypothetical protein